MLRLVESADVLVEGLRPGVTERLGLGPDACHERNPRLVYGRVTGWGQTGPLAMTAGHDLNYVAITGALFGLGQDPAQAALPDQPRRRLRRRLDVPGHRCPRRPVRGPRVGPSARWSTRPSSSGTAHLNAMTASHLASGMATELARGQPARRRRAVLRPLRDRHGRHLSVGAARAAVLRRFVDLLGIADSAPDRETRPSTPSPVSDARSPRPATTATTPAASSTSTRRIDTLRGAQCSPSTGRSASGPALRRQRRLRGPVLPLSEAVGSPHLVDRRRTSTGPAPPNRRRRRGSRRHRRLGHDCRRRQPPRSAPAHRGHRRDASGAAVQADLVRRSP